MKKQTLEQRLKKIEDWLEIDKINVPPKQECKCKKPQGCRFLDKNNEYDCIRCHDCGLPLPTNTKELRERLHNVLEYEMPNNHINTWKLADSILALLVK